MTKKIARLLAICCLLVHYACSPLKSSPNEEKHQMELTIHEMQTGIDDLKHDYNCYQTELQILDGKIKNQEGSLTDIKTVYFESQKTKLETALTKLSSFEKRLSAIEKKLTAFEQDIETLSSHANNSTSAFIQHKEKIDELEELISSHTSQFKEIIKLKKTIQAIAQSVGNYQFYKVKRGDSLERIAKDHKTSIAQIKKMNHLDNDLIVIDQELKIPAH